MTPEMDRAHQLASVFINAGERWQFCVPLDCTVDDDTVTFPGMTMEYSNARNGWRLTGVDDDCWVVLDKAAG